MQRNVYAFVHFCAKNRTVYISWLKNLNFRDKKGGGRKKSPRVSEMIASPIVAVQKKGQDMTHW